MTSRQTTIVRRISCLFCATWLVALSGCSGAATIKGKVTFQGRPVTHGSVILISADGRGHSGVIQHDGSFTVEDVPRGQAKVAVVSRNPSKGRTTLNSDKPGHQGKI